MRKPIDKRGKRPQVLNKPPLEIDIQKLILQYLTHNGWFATPIRERYKRDKAGKINGECSVAGIPDIVAIKRGRIVMFEVKRPLSSYSKPNEAQKAWHREWQSEGGEVYVVRGIDEVQKIICGGAVC